MITAKGLPGMPIVWMLEFPGGKVGLSVLVDFLNACIENYDEVARELWPVRDHEKRYFGKDAGKGAGDYYGLAGDGGFGESGEGE